MDERIKKQMNFIIEVDKLKNIFRQTYISDGSRRENDSEHSWHLALMAIVLAEHSNNVIDIIKVLKMVIIHDIVEIDAGDTFAYDKRGHIDKYERESAAANRIFGILPEDQKNEMILLWKEFEDRQTNEAKFAAALDRIHPILLNYLSGGKTWMKYNISRMQVEERNGHTKEGSVNIWDYILKILDESVEKGYLTNKKE